MFFYGHGSAALVIIGVMVVARLVATQRRRGAYGRNPGRSFTSGPPGPGHHPPPGFDGGTGPGMGGVGYSGIPAGWLVDPTGRHQQRYWSGTEWTERVVDDGVSGTDPPPA